MLQGWRLASPRSDRLRRFEVPSDSTFQRVLSALDAPALERRLAVWLDALDPHRQDGICIEGKTLRGSRDGDGHPLHLLSALTQGSLQFLGQGPVDHKTNEIRAVRPWLDPLDRAGRAVPLAALHPQPATARYLVFERDADYLFTLKDNQKQFKTPRCPPVARFFFPLSTRSRSVALTAALSGATALCRPSAPATLASWPPRRSRACADIA